MLKIQSELQETNNIIIDKNKHKKKQILLFDTKRRYVDYLAKIYNRITDNHEDLPHFLITKTGEVLQIIDDKLTINTFKNPRIDNKIIKIAIENLGWLQKNTITGIYNNWVGDPYRITPHSENWRNYFFWDAYTEKQEQALHELCEYLCEKHDIPFQIVGSQKYTKTANKLNGIVCKSNYDINYTDINKSFNFNTICTNQIEV